MTTWTEDQIRRELRRFLRGRSEWPPYREFQRSGLKALRDQVTHTGGARRWAEELGVRYIDHRPGYARIWTEDRIRRELGGYLAGREQWPSRREFERDGRKALRDAINRTGGVDRWASEFALQRPDRRSGLWRGWTPEMIEQELSKLIGERGTWPSRREFQAAGLSSMLTSIYTHEGPEFWAEGHGRQAPAALAASPGGIVDGAAHSRRAESLLRRSRHVAGGARVHRGGAARALCGSQSQRRRGALGRGAWVAPRAKAFLTGPDIRSVSSQAAMKLAVDRAYWR